MLARRLFDEKNRENRAKYGKSAENLSYTNTLQYSLLFSVDRRVCY